MQGRAIADAGKVKSPAYLRIVDRRREGWKLPDERVLCGLLCGHEQCLHLGACRAGSSAEAWQDPAH